MMSWWIIQSKTDITFVTSNPMKLYATVTSERASKGQGGRELLIEVFNEERLKVLEGEIRYTENGLKIYVSTTIGDRETENQCIDFFLPTKGKQQKGEKYQQWCRCTKSILPHVEH